MDDTPNGATVWLVCGWPDCGKTTLGDWLHITHGWRHVDMEAFQGSFLHWVWESGGASRLMDALYWAGGATVLTWGFPADSVQCQSAIRSMVAHGAHPAWLMADSWALVQAGILANPEKGTAVLASLSAQRSRIERSDAALSSLFPESSRLTTLTAARRLPPSEIAQRLRIPV